MAFYLFNPDNNLYYEMTASVEVSTGYITASVSQSGISTNPGWIPLSGETLIPLEYYLTVFNLETSEVDGNQFNVVSMSVTKYIERYTCNSWTGISVPEDLLYTGANMIRDRITDSNNKINPALKSESVKNYSYTIQDGYLNKASFSKYIEELDGFRIIPFA